MASFVMTLYREVFGNGSDLHFMGLHNAVWVKSGLLIVDGQETGKGEGTYLSADTSISVKAVSDTEILRFVLMPEMETIEPLSSNEPLLTCNFDMVRGPVFLRLDQVSFPPGARAYRHVHPGAGIRYLNSGSLVLQSDHATTTIESGQAWFENANSSVQATATTDQSAAFVRAMILPQEYFAKPTIQYLDRADDNKPRLQTNRRFFDQPIKL